MSWGEGTVPRACVPRRTRGQSFGTETLFHRFDFCRKGVFLAQAQTRLGSCSPQIFPYLPRAMSGHAQKC